MCSLFYWILYILGFNAKKSKLEELFKLDNPVIEGGGLGIYISTTEIKKLVTSAKNYKPVQAL